MKPILIYIAILATIAVFKPQKDINIYVAAPKVDKPPYEKLLNIPNTPPPKDFWKQYQDPAFKK